MHTYPARRWLFLPLSLVGCLGEVVEFAPSEGEDTPPSVSPEPGERDAGPKPGSPSSSSSGSSSGGDLLDAGLDAGPEPDAAPDATVPDGSLPIPSWADLANVPLVVSTVTVPPTFTQLDAFAARDGHVWLGSGDITDRTFVETSITAQGQLLAGTDAGVAGLGRVVMAHGETPRAYVAGTGGRPPVLLGGAPLAFCTDFDACATPETCATGTDVVGLGELSGGAAVAVTSAGLVYTASSDDGTCFTQTDRVNASFAQMGLGSTLGDRLLLPINEVVANAHRALSVAPDGTATIVTVGLTDQDAKPTRLAALAPQSRNQLFATVLRPTGQFMQFFIVQPDGAGNLVQAQPPDNYLLTTVDLATAELAGGQGATFYAYPSQFGRSAGLTKVGQGVAHNLPANADALDYHLTGDATRFWQAVYCPHGVGASSAPVVRVEGKRWTAITFSNTENSMTSCNP